MQINESLYKSIETKGNPMKSMNIAANKLTSVGINWNKNKSNEINGHRVNCMTSMETNANPCDLLKPMQYIQIHVPFVVASGAFCNLFRSLQRFCTRGSWEWEGSRLSSHLSLCSSERLPGKLWVSFRYRFLGNGAWTQVLVFVAPSLFWVTLL